ncbi:hypothetical protein DES53_107153 [Roseimicrobium gellanilyticum]|uniref:Uncharacterized protein n=1 Tax=Roseimicrobium gellanilyticum TaxID=748857 RepID=A0A366HFI1_9BACT|nr:hypothetical protein [Roseimicrobium gellanilyticum]RBP41322.1 hypothetical protein DES53_107153 [Roseimicrobium gellanilyticum]
MKSTLILGLLGLITLLLPTPAAAQNFKVTETDELIHVTGTALDFSVRKKGYVSGVAAGSMLDKKTGFRDPGFGLDIVDFLMESGSDETYRAQVPETLRYEFNNPHHGNIAKRLIEGPQICTQAKELSPQVIRGSDFIAVTMNWKYHQAAPDKKAGSQWSQTLVFPEGKRYFISTDKVTSANDSDGLFLRIDMPGHVKHKEGDTFSEIYLSYSWPPPPDSPPFHVRGHKLDIRHGGTVPASAFLTNFAPDEKFHYRREGREPPKRFIRAYRLRDSKTGADGPWLAGMTLNAVDVYEAWCHQRNYVCFIQEIGGRPIKAGESFSAAFIVGYFDSIEEMQEVYNQYSGHSGLEVSKGGWRLTK